MNLGDRMKEYERAFSGKYPIRMPLVLRLDGVHFHTNVKKWKCRKPFDYRLIDSMIRTSFDLCKTIPGAQIAYTQSDEITILIRDDQTFETEPWFGKKINKITSVTASMATALFNEAFRAFHNVDINMPCAFFDCRGFVLPENEIYNIFLWRQQDATRNAIQMVGRSQFSHKELHKKSCDQIQDMLFLLKKINFNDLPTIEKRGTCIVKGEDGKWFIDKEIPIFSQDPDYINRFAKLSN